MESFGLLRTNPSLTTNVKVVISQDKLYFESFDSNDELGDDKFKRVIIEQDSFYNLELAKFWKNTTTEKAFQVLNLEDFDIMYQNFNDQIDDIYLSGAANVRDTDYPEEFEYLAPLHITQGDLPKDFLIFRVDNPGLINLSKDNFKEEILDQFKVVNRFDLRVDTKLGKFLDNSFNQNNLPVSAISIDFNLGEFTYWNGIDYDTGNYVSKSEILDNEFNREMTFTQGNQLLNDGFKNNNVIYPYIINLKFLFDDTPATPDSLRKWSINRYYGFYGNLEEIESISPYKPPALKTGMKLDSNNVFTIDGEPVDPFERGFKADRTYYVEYNNEFYLVEKISDTEFKIISDITLPTDVDTNFNQNTITFGDNNEMTYLNTGSSINVSSTADVLIAEINGQYHRMLNNGTDWLIHSDYKFTVTNNIFKYFINKSDPNFTTIINLNEVDRNNPPLKFRVYQFNFKPVKDFDLDILETDFARYEYEHLDEITETEEPKLYQDDLIFSGTPKPIVQYIYKNRVTSVPAGSEFLSTSELYQVLENNGVPNRMWVKNPEILKWGILDSLSGYDYPYLFNVNRKADDYNRTTDVEQLVPDRELRNLDYFYTLASASSTFGFTTSIIYQSLNIIDNEFNIEKYFNVNNTDDYFDSLFGQTFSYNSIIEPRKKYSLFLRGDQDTPNQTVFKGIKFSIHDLESVLTETIDGNKVIESFNIRENDNFKDYKFSIILTDLKKDPTNDFATVSQFTGWKRIKNWERNVTYNINDVVLFNGARYKNANGQYGFNGYTSSSATGSITPTEYIYPDGTIETLTIDGFTLSTIVSSTGPNDGIEQLFICTSTSSISDPTLSLVDTTDWSVYPDITTRYTIFYQPNRTYTAWDPVTASHSHLIDTDSNDNYNFVNYVALYEGEYYLCTEDQTSSQRISPNYVEIGQNNGLQVEYWRKIEAYSTTKNYTSDQIVTLDGNLYYFEQNTQDLLLIFQFDPVSQTAYNKYDIIKLNDNYYTDITGNSELNNGINIYINKKWKNILVHIYSSDGIIEPNLIYNSRRDNLYKTELQQLSAANFIETINELTMTNGFVNTPTYFIINDFNDFTVYDIGNIESLPHILQMESPVPVEFYSNSLIINRVDVNRSVLDIRKEFINNQFETIDEIDFYNGGPFAIEYRRPDIFNFQDKQDTVYRFSGDYNPVFKEIQLFDFIEGNRYNFNTTYTQFGILPEMVKSKINKENLLRIMTDDYKSIYPQVDEIGYFVDSHFIFKSTWDQQFYKKTNRNN